MKAQTTIDEAIQEIAKAVVRANIPGFVSSYHVGLYNPRVSRQVIRESKDRFSCHSFSWSQAWGVNCNLRFSFDEVTKRKGGALVKRSEVVAAISWGSTGRDALSARAAVMLYSAVVDLATLVEVHFRDRDIESEDQAHKRWQNIWDEKQAIKVATFKKELKPGQKFNFLNLPGSGVPGELWEHLGTCDAKASKKSSMRCGAKTKFISWSSEFESFVARCGSHANARRTEHDVNAQAKAAA